MDFFSLLIWTKHKVGTNTEPPQVMLVLHAHIMGSLVFRRKTSVKEGLGTGRRKFCVKFVRFSLIWGGGCVNEIRFTPKNVMHWCMWKTNEYREVAVWFMCSGVEGKNSGCGQWFPSPIACLVPRVNMWNALTFLLFYLFLRNGFLINHKMFNKAKFINWKSTFCFRGSISNKLHGTESKCWIYR